MNETLLQRIKQRYGIVGNAEGLNRAIDVALKIAPVDLSVLIMGEIFPRIIHDNSARKTKKYFAVNCGAIPEGTIDSELFGHEKGAFTGAVEKREGYFSVADGGTLFLDEVGELPLQTQARLLRVLETGEFIPVGSSQVKKTDVRIVAATNVNMDRAINDGKFREDLYYRLNSILITIPPLRERGEDATLLFRKFALDMSEKYKMPPIRLTEDAKAVLMHYSWPGNIRQLRNVAENMSVTAEEREITAEVLRQYIPEERPHNQLVVSDPQVKEHSFENEREILYQILFDLRRDVSELKKTVNEQLKGQSCDLSDRKGLPAFNSHYVDPQTFAEAEEVRDGEETKPILSLEEQEREAIGRVLEQNKGNRKLTAEQLGISERTLYRKIKEYDLEN